MPPVRDASTKPSAATDLPAPVACSNQNRRAAFGSSAAASPSPGASSSSSDGASSCQSSGSSSSEISSSPSSSTSPDGSSSTAAGAEPLRAPSPLPPAPCASASSAISVPDSAST